MALWLNHVTIAAPKNGSTTHTVDPSSATNAVGGTPFTPTAGRFLLCIVSGAVTSTTPSGWTLPTNGSAINNVGTYVFYRASAAGGDTITTTHNGSDYSVAFDIYEYTAGTSFVAAASNVTQSTTSANPNLTGLTGTNTVFGVKSGFDNVSDATITATWNSPNVEATDLDIQPNVTDGILLFVCYQDSYTSASYQPTGTATGGFGFGNDNGITFAIALPPPNPYLTAAGAFFAAASGTSITPVIPAGAQADDIMVMAAMTNGSSTFSTPTGWTILGTKVESNSNESAAWFWKRHTGAESNPTSTTSASLSTTNGGYGRIYVYRNATTSGSPFEGEAVNTAASTSTTPTSTSITTTGNDRLVVCLTSNDDDNAWSSGNPPAGWSISGALVTSTTGGDAGMSGIDQAAPTASTIGAVSVGTMAASDFWRTITFALIPPGAASFTGTIAVTTADATSNLTGTSTVGGNTGTMAVTTAAATSSITGTVVNPATGSIAATTANATASLTGTFVAPPGISFVGSSATTWATRSNTAVTAPVGVADGDYILLGILTGAATEAPDPTPPAGFTLITGFPSDISDPGGFNVETRVYAKFAASEGATWTFTHTSCSAQGFALVYRGVDATTPLDVAATVATRASTGLGATPSVATGLTTVTAGAWVVFIEHDWGDTTNNLTPPGGTTPTFTERIDTTLVYAADGVMSTAGATGNESLTNNNTSGSAQSQWMAALLALRPTQAPPDETGSIAATTADATSSISGTYTGPPRTGSIATTLANASAALSGTASVGGETGTIAAVTENAVASLAGTRTVPAFTGSIAATTANATSSLTGRNILSVAAENALTGNPSTDWDGVTGFGTTLAFGFADNFSVEAGTTIGFKIHCPAGGTLDIYRMGYYAGNGGRLWGSVSIPATTQTDGTLRTTGEGGVGSRDCSAWTTACSWAVPTNAVPGIYLGVIKRTGGGRSHILFIVKNDVATTRADLIVRTPDFTWAAYGAFGTIASPTSGRSLYGAGTNVFDQANTRAWDVSFNRPMTVRDQVVNSFFAINYPVVKFLERQGYDMAYVSSLDVHNDASLLLNHQAMISFGHDEYWSPELRQAWDDAQDAGVNSFIMSGNTMLWKVRISGALMTCYKDSHTLDGRGTGRDPVTWTGTWRDTRTPSGNQPPHDPEVRSIGLFFIANGVRNDELLVRFIDKSRPIWRNCAAVQALTTGQTYNISQDLVGFEWDYIRPSHPDNPAGMIAVSQTTGIDLTNNAANVDGSWYDQTLNPATHNVVAYQKAGSGALVVNLGLTNWGWALDSYHDLGPSSTVDTVAQQATVNVLRDMGVIPTTLMAGLTAPTDQRSTWFGTNTGTIGATTGNATSSLAGTSTPPAFTGTIATSTANATSSLAGTATPPTSSGVIVATTANATSSIAGTRTVPTSTGSIAASTANATAALTGTRTTPTFTGSLAATTGNATAAISGTSIAGGNTGTLNAATANATAALAGTYVAPNETGSIAASTANVTATLTGTFAPSRTGSLASSTAPAVATLAGTHAGPPRTGSIAATAADATMGFAGTLVGTAAVTVVGATSSVAVTGATSSVTVVGASATAIVGPEDP